MNNTPNKSKKRRSYIDKDGNAYFANTGGYHEIKKPKSVKPKKKKK